MQSTKHIVNLCCMRKSYGISYDLCNKENMQHNAQSHHVHTLMLYWTFVACNCPVHVGVENEKNLFFVSFPALKSVCVVSLQTVFCKLHTYIICNI